MALKTKPIVTVKTGIWENPKKLGKAMENMAFMYSLVVGGSAFYHFFAGSLGIGIMYTIFTIPLLIIIYSHHSYAKLLKTWEEKQLHGTE